MIRKIIAGTRYVVGGVFFCLVCFFFSIAFMFRPFNRENCSICSQTAGKIVLEILGIKVRVKNLERLFSSAASDSPAILIANHQHTIDILVLGSILPSGAVTIGKRSLI
ncbi:MAG: 1-acyl-sn-glycerol-3-phosphate acyltransferase, partial [Oligoflexia bacterium]|nr:1-acyl-sn-glycerol-3-phosphate acyltransferase [Oligoflexia bacterium]